MIRECIIIKKKPGILFVLLLDVMMFLFGFQDYWNQHNTIWLSSFVFLFSCRSSKKVHGKFSLIDLAGIASHMAQCRCVNLAFMSIFMSSSHNKIFPFHLWTFICLEKLHKNVNLLGHTKFLTRPSSLYNFCISYIVTIFLLFLLGCMYDGC